MAVSLQPYVPISYCNGLRDVSVLLHSIGNGFAFERLLRDLRYLHILRCVSFERLG